jgi:hypothetical protein
MEGKMKRIALAAAMICAISTAHAAEWKYMQSPPKQIVGLWCWDGDNGNVSAYSRPDRKNNCKDGSLPALYIGEKLVRNINGQFPITKVGKYGETYGLRVQDKTGKEDEYHIVMQADGRMFSMKATDEAPKAETI